MSPDETMDDVSDLVPFRFEIREEHIANASQRTIDRLMAFVNARMTEGAELEQARDWTRLVSTVAGRLPQPCVTALQALAMGHDLDAVMDLIEDREERP